MSMDLEDHPHSYPPIETVSGRIALRGSEDEEREDETANRNNNDKILPQAFAAFASTVGATLLGTSVGWSGPGLNLLDKDTTKGFEVNDLEASFIASLMPAGALIGGAMAGVAISKFGRVANMYITLGIFSFAYMMLASAQNVWMLLIGRLNVGYAVGMTSITVPTYIAEVSSPAIRGTLGSLFQLQVTIGVLLIGLIGAAIPDWRWLSVSNLFLCLLWAILAYFLPESPLYLVKNRRYDEARQALEFLRGHRNIEDELADIQIGVDATNRRGNVPFSNLFTVARFRRPLVISLVLMLGQQFSGINAVLFFSVSIFESAGTPLNSFVENVIIAAIQVLATLFASIFMDKFGRRIFLNLSGLVIAISLFGLGTYFWILDTEGKEAAASVGFLPLLCLCVFIAAFSVGYGPVPWLMMSELHSDEVKERASSITASFNWTMSFLVTQFFTPAKKAFGAAASFWFFASVMVVIFVFVLIAVPETKGKSSEQIQELFRDRNDDDDVDEAIETADRSVLVDNEVFDQQNSSSRNERI